VTGAPLDRGGVPLWKGAGLEDVRTALIDVEAACAGFDDFWAPFASGIGPAAGHLVAQTEERRAVIREACREILGRPTGPFTLPARVLGVRGRA
jgi:hypothetical protein